MAIALVGSPVVPAGNPTTGFTLTIPAVSAGDICLLTLVSRGSTGLGSLAVTDDEGAGSWTIAVPNPDHKLTLWWKRASANTAGKTLTVAGAVNSCAGVLKCFSGVIATDPPYTDVSTEENASADETHAGITPSQADSMLCAVIANGANDNAVTSLSFATAGALSMTEKLSTGGNDCACAFGHLLQSGGPTATGNLTWSQVDGQTRSTIFTLKPSTSTIVEAEGSSSGGATVTGVGAAIGASVGSSAGAATVNGVAAAVATSVGASAGVASVSGFGGGIVESVGSSSGSATVLGEGSVVVTAEGTSSGIATVLGDAAAVFASVGSASGVATVDGVAGMIVGAVGVAEGVAAVLGIGESLVAGDIRGDAYVLEGELSADWVKEGSIVESIYVESGYILPGYFAGEHYQHADPTTADYTTEGSISESLYVERGYILPGYFAGELYTQASALAATWTKQARL